MRFPRSAWSVDGRSQATAPQPAPLSSVTAHCSAHTHTRSPAGMRETFFSVPGWARSERSNSRTGLAHDSLGSQPRTLPSRPPLIRNCSPLSPGLHVPCISAVLHTRTQYSAAAHTHAALWGATHVLTPKACENGPLCLLRQCVPVHAARLFRLSLLSWPTIIYMTE